MCLDGVFGPWFLPLVAREFEAAGTQVAYVLLEVDLEEALARVRQRSGSEMDTMVRTMHAAFQQPAPGLDGHRIATMARTPDAVAQAIEQRLAGDALRLDLRSWARADR